MRAILLARGNPPIIEDDGVGDSVTGRTAGAAVDGSVPEGPFTMKAMKRMKALRLASRW